MSSRLRENPKRLFEVFFEIARPNYANDGGKEFQDPFILQMYPPDYEDKEVLKNVPKFAFPCDTERYTTTVDHFTFVLTDLESKYTFGFCRHATGAQTCLCIISYLPWFEVFYQLLNLLAEIMNRSEDNDMTVLLRQTFVNEIPIAEVPVTIVAGMDMFSFTSPDPKKLPSIQSNRNMLEYYSAIDTNRMMIIFASMLNERRILFTSKKLSRLTACVHASAALLLPMHWQHLYIPVLPEHLIDYVSAPMPFLIGVHSTLMEKVRIMELGDAVVVNADTGEVETEYCDLEDLPSEVSNFLKKQLKVDKVKNSMGDVISKAFLLTLVRLIGGYRDALRFRPGEPVTFDPESFVQSRSITMRGFLENMIHQQIFQEFINGRLDMLNSGEGFTDIFEEEATKHVDKMNASSRYKEWSNNMKKQGKKMQKGSKDVWADFKEKMKSQGKKVYSGIKSKVGELKKDESTIKPKSIREGTLTHSFSRDRPSTIVGPELRGRRPPRPPFPENRLTVASLQLPGKRDSQERKYKLINIDDTTPRSVDDTDLFNYNRVSMTLMTDPDIQNTLHKSASAQDLSDRQSHTPNIANRNMDSSGKSTTKAVGSTGNMNEAIDSRLVNKTTDNIGSSYDDSSTPGTTSSVDAKNHTSASTGKRPVPLPRRSLDREKMDILKDRLITDVPAPVVPPRIPLNSKVIASPTADNRDNQEPLIRLDSNELDPNMAFDPFSVDSTEKKNSSIFYTSDVNQSSGIKNSKFHVRSHPTRTSLNRSPAFKRDIVSEPRRHGVKPDVILTEPASLQTCGMSFFDPLSTPPSKGSDNGIKHQHSTQSLTNDNALLQSWNMSSLLTSPVNNATSPIPNAFSTPPPKPCQPPAQSPSPIPGTTSPSSVNNPIYFTPPRPKISAHRPRPRSANQDTSLLGIIDNPLYDPPSETVSHKEQKTSSSLVGVESDPFGDLGKPPSSTGKWETFD